LQEAPPVQYFTHIIVEQQVAMMEMWLHLGFELDLYSVDEFDAVYWYDILSNFLESL
jgi:hypothetical protein